MNRIAVPFQDTRPYLHDPLRRKVDEAGVLEGGDAESTLLRLVQDGEFVDAWSAWRLVNAVHGSVLDVPDLVSERVLKFVAASHGSGDALYNLKELQVLNSSRCCYESDSGIHYANYHSGLKNFEDMTYNVFSRKFRHYLLYNPLFEVPHDAVITSSGDPLGHYINNSYAYLTPCMTVETLRYKMSQYRLSGLFYHVEKNPFTTEGMVFMVLKELLKDPESYSALGRSTRHTIRKMSSFEDSLVYASSMMQKVEDDEIREDIVNSISDSICAEWLSIATPGFDAAAPSSLVKPLLFEILMCWANDSQLDDVVRRLAAPKLATMV